MYFDNLKYLNDNFLLQGGSLSVHEDLKMLSGHALSEHSESDSTPPIIAPPDLNDTIDGKFTVFTCLGIFLHDFFHGFCLA